MKSKETSIMKKRIFIPVLAFLYLTCLSVSAQSGSAEESIKIISTDGNELEIVNSFKETAGKHFTDPKAPRFLLYDQKRDVAFGIGGSVRLRTAYDFSGSPTSSDAFIPYAIPVSGNRLNKDGFRMNANNSTLFFKLLGNNDKIGQYQLYISGVFNGDGNAFTLQDAYMKVYGFTIGRTWSTFNDPSAVPPTIDWQGPNGAAEMRTEQIRYERNITDDLSFGVAAELSQTTGRYGQSIKDLEMSQRIPDVPAYVQYAFGANKGSHVRLAGVLRNMNYLNEVKDKTEYATGYGVQLSSKIVATPLFTFYGQMNYGNGIGQYINDLSGNGLSLVAAADNAATGKMKAVEAMGWFAQGQVNITSSLFATLGYSQARIFPKSDKLDLAGTNYRYGQYVVGNVFYNLTSDLQVGLEYLYGERVNINKEKGHANRVQALVQFNF